MKTKKYIYLAVSLTLIIIGIIEAKHAYTEKQYLGPDAPESINLEEITDQEIASSLNIEMPFFAQAPFGNWDYPWQEACEEASVLLVANLYGDLNYTTESFNQELLYLVEWEKDYFGAYEHTTVKQTEEMMKINFGYETVIHENPTFNDIKEIINNGHLIIAPFAGKYLYNPNFRNGGPNYHMLVIKGYNEKNMQIVTHDVGTRNGEDYVYDWSVIEYALHDWHDNDILLGEKKIIEVLP